MKAIRQAPPASIANLAQLEELLSEPTDAVVTALSRLEGDIIFLGIGGKMGPSLARMAKRASDAAGASRRIIGGCRLSDPQLELQLRSHGVETIRADLLDESQFAKLP